MDPAFHLQQRIAQGLTDVSLSLRNSFTSLVMGSAASNNDAVATAASAHSQNTATGSSDLDLEKGQPEIENGIPMGIILRPGSKDPGTGDGTSGDPSLDTDAEDKAVRQPDAADAIPQPPPAAPRTLLNLPAELQIMIVEQLNFCDIERLRRTCRFYRNLATPSVVRSIFGDDYLRSLVVATCARCLAFDGDMATLLCGAPLHRGFPLCSLCVDCAVAARDDRLVVGRKVSMGNGDNAWVCRWCGWPVIEAAAPGHVQFHRTCYRRYNDALLFFFLLGWVQLALGIVAAALAWRYFRDDILVFAPTVLSFITLWMCFFVLMFRGNRVRTYHWSLLLELIIVGCWIPPIYFLALIYSHNPFFDLPKAYTAAMVMFCLNLIFRVLNVLGNIILVCEYQRTRHHLPKKMIPFWRRVTNPVFDALIFWTYPQSVEQKYPPRWG